MTTSSLFLFNSQRRRKRLPFSSFRKLGHRQGSRFMFGRHRRFRKMMCQPTTETTTSKSHSRRFNNNNNYYRWFFRRRQTKAGTTDSDDDDDDDVDDDQSPTSGETGRMTDEEEELSQHTHNANFDYGIQQESSEDVHSERATCSTVDSAPLQQSERSREPPNNSMSSNSDHNNGSTAAFLASNRRAGYPPWWDASLLDMEQDEDDDDKEEEDGDDDDDEDNDGQGRETSSIVDDDDDGRSNNSNTHAEMRTKKKTRGYIRKGEWWSFGHKRLFFSKWKTDGGSSRWIRFPKKRWKPKQHSPQPRDMDDYSDSLLHDRQVLSAFTVVPTPTTIDASNPMGVECIRIPQKKKYQWELGLYATTSRSMQDTTTVYDDHESTCLAVSFSEECAQLVVHQSKSSDDEFYSKSSDDEVNDYQEDDMVLSLNEYPLGAAFPHPVAAASFDKPSDSSEPKSPAPPSLLSYKEGDLQGIGYKRTKNIAAIPPWLDVAEVELSLDYDEEAENAEENVWNQIESDPFFGGDFTDPPPPIVNLETTDSSTSGFTSFWSSNSVSGGGGIAGMETTNRNYNYGWENLSSTSFPKLGWSFSQDDISIVSFSDSISNNIYKPIRRLAKDVPSFCGVSGMEDDAPYDEVKMYREIYDIDEASTSELGESSRSNNLVET